MNKNYYINIISKLFNNKLSYQSKNKIKYELYYRVPNLVCEYYILKNNYKFYICPTCKITISYEYINYCTNCGQCLCWYGTIKNGKRIK